VHLCKKLSLDEFLSSSAAMMHGETQGLEITIPGRHNHRASYTQVAPNGEGIWPAPAHHRIGTDEEWRKMGSGRTAGTHLNFKLRCFFWRRTTTQRKKFYGRSASYGLPERENDENAQMRRIVLSVKILEEGEINFRRNFIRP